MRRRMWQHGYHYSAQVLGCGPDDQGCLLFFTATSVEDHMHDLSPHPSRKPPVMAEEPHQGMDRRGFLTSFSLTRFSEAALGVFFGRVRLRSQILIEATCTVPSKIAARLS